MTLHPSAPPQSTVSKHGSQFRGNSQHDALEFLLWLLDRVHEDVHLQPYNNNSLQAPPKVNNSLQAPSKVNNSLQATSKVNNNSLQAPPKVNNNSLLAPPKVNNSLQATSKVHNNCLQCPVPRTSISGLTRYVELKVWLSCVTKVDLF